MNISVPINNKFKIHQSRAAVYFIEMSDQDFKFYFEEQVEFQQQFPQPKEMLEFINKEEDESLLEYIDLNSFKLDEALEFKSIKGNLKLIKNKEHLSIFDDKVEDDLEFQFFHNQDFWGCEEQQNIIFKFEVKKESSLMFNSLSSSQTYLNLIPELEPTPIFNKSGNIRKKLGRKPIDTGLNQRKDVVLKAVLRKMHSFFWKDINSETKYIRLKKRRGIQSFEEWLNLYIKNKLNEKPNDHLVLVLGSIACSSDMKDFISRKPHQESKASLKRISNQLSIVELIYNTLYKFSFSKFKSLAKRPEMLTIMTYFVSRLENSFSEDEKIGVQILINQCRSALN